jgi:hypothetical protein
MLIVAAIAQGASEEKDMARTFSAEKRRWI